jgi:hypothetical protein
MINTYSFSRDLEMDKEAIHANPGPHIVNKSTKLPSCVTILSHQHFRLVLLRDMTQKGE